MARRQVLVQLSDELMATLDAVATREGVSRSEVVRRAIRRSYGDELSREIDRLIVEGYRRIPPGTIDEWGDLSASAGASLGETMRRLDSEDGGWDDVEVEGGR
jgi:predicted transcriptional regulator